MLTQTLRALEHDGLVTRTVFAEVPPHVQHEPKALGATLREPLKALEDRATTHMGAVSMTSIGVPMWTMTPAPTGARLRLVTDRLCP